MSKESKRNIEQIDIIDSSESPEKKIRKTSQESPDSDCKIANVQNSVLREQCKDLPPGSNSDLSQCMAPKTTSTEAAEDTAVSSAASRVNSTDVGAGAGPSTSTQISIGAESIASPSTPRINGTDAGASTTKVNSTAAEADEDTAPIKSDTYDIIKVDSDKEDNADAAPLDPAQDTKPLTCRGSPQSVPLDLSLPVAKSRRVAATGRYSNMTDKRARDIKRIGERLLSKLHQKGVCVIRDFMEENILKEILKEVQRIEAKGHFCDAIVSAPLGCAPILDDSHKMYTCHRDLPGHAAIYELTGKLDYVLDLVLGALRSDMNISRSEPTLEFYRAMNVTYMPRYYNPVKDGRFMTAVYYLNDNWDNDKHGGMLKFWPHTGGIKEVRVKPEINKAMFFWSDLRCAQQLSPTIRKRYSITVQYFNQDEYEQHKEETWQQFRSLSGSTSGSVTIQMQT